ncbi:hypothetical protein HAX54_031271 [Datura stramonium]|uniref:U-box domain-containing protein n=1 Tax=Datura stramonium TaxID=4076 RepID=A0ABS8SBT3_DATST|nr:hypothetical protein [Datura stramonium]
MPGSLDPLDVGVQIPYHFRCPISLELMRDPVTVCTGQTYDRQSIESWVATGNTTCPVTRAPLSSFARHSESYSSPANTGMAARSNHTNSRLSALRRLRGLARDSDKNSGMRFVASDLDRVNYLVALLFHPSVDVRVNSAALIEIVVAGMRSPELRAQISNADDVFEGVDFREMRCGKSTRNNPNSSRIPSGCAALASHALTVPLLVKIILKISERATEYAAGALLSLCSASEQAQKGERCRRRVDSTAVVSPKRLYRTCEAKAQMLLKRLRDRWPDDSIAS